MKINKKTFLSILFCFPIFLVSCTNYSQKDVLNSLIKNQEIVTNPVIDNKQKETENILNRILNAAFRNDKLKILEYKKSQSENKKIITEFQNNAKQFNELKTQEEKIKFGKSQEKLFSENWYFFLTNLNLFKFNFLEFVKTDGVKNIFFSKEFIEKNQENYQMNVRKYRNETVFLDSYLDEIIEGDESKELGDSSVFYIKKKNIIFRIIVSNLFNNSKQPVVSFKSNNWFFVDSLANTISLRVVSSAFHQIFIHNIGQQDFEHEIVNKQKYGAPAFIFPTLFLDEDLNNKNRNESIDNLNQKLKKENNNV